MASPTRIAACGAITLFLAMLFPAGQSLSQEDPPPGAVVDGKALKGNRGMGDFLQALSSGNPIANGTGNKACGANYTDIVDLGSDKDIAVTVTNTCTNGGTGCRLTFTLRDQAGAVVKGPSGEVQMGGDSRTLGGVASRVDVQCLAASGGGGTCTYNYVVRAQ